MIVSLAVVLLAAALGCAVVWQYAGLAALRPRWAAWSLALGAGIAFGLGATSILWFLATLAAPGLRVGVLAIESGALAWTVFAIRRGAATPAAATPAPIPGNLVAAVLLLLALVTVVVQLGPAWQANPQGGWDAWSIWNLRAKFMAAPDGLAARAWSGLLDATHPEYPLLASGAVARAWSLGANAGPEAPIAISFLFFLSVIASATGAVAIWRGASSGLLTGLVLASTPALSLQTVSQYADVPLAAFFTGAIAFAMLDRPLWAGLLAGMAAWTKDEGALFCAVLLVAMAAFRRRDLARTALGLLPGVLVYAGFKLLLAPQVSVHTSAGVLARLFDSQRYPAVVAGALRYFAWLGIGWYHPILPVAALAAGTGLRREGRDQAWFCSLVAGLTLLGYLAFVTATRDDLQWQIDTAMGRLYLQWWPLALFAAMAWIRSAEETAVVAEAEPAARKGAREKRKKS